MNSCELVSFITALSCGIAKCYPKEELPLLISVLSQLAGTLATIVENDDLNSSGKATPIEKLPNNVIVPDNNPVPIVPSNESTTLLLPQ